MWNHAGKSRLIRKLGLIVLALFLAFQFVGADPPHAIADRDEAHASENQGRHGDRGRDSSDNGRRPHGNDNSAGGQGVSQTDGPDSAGKGNTGGKPGKSDPDDRPDRNNGRPEDSPGPGEDKDKDSPEQVKEPDSEANDGDSEADKSEATDQPQDIEDNDEPPNNDNSDESEADESEDDEAGEDVEDSDDAQPSDTGSGVTIGAEGESNEDQDSTPAPNDPEDTADDGETSDEQAEQPEAEQPDDTDEGDDNGDTPTPNDPEDTGGEGAASDEQTEQPDADQPDADQPDATEEGNDNVDTPAPNEPEDTGGEGDTSDVQADQPDADQPDATEEGDDNVDAPAPNEPEGDDDEAATGASTEGVLLSQSNNPEFLCTWVLPDMQPDNGGDSGRDEDIQYDTSDAARMGDDDMEKRADPCSLNSDKRLTTPENASDLIQVRPVPGDKHGERIVQVWGALGGDTDAEVSWQVLYPDDTEKAQLLPQRIGGDAQTRIEECRQLGDANTVASMFRAAVSTGQLTANAVDDANFGLLAGCEEDLIGLYQASFSISSEEPCGQYTILGEAMKGDGKSEISGTIDVLCFWYLEIDFDNVDWGRLTPGHAKHVSGNLEWEPKDEALPTIRNLGNHGLGVGVSFSPMQRVDEDGKPVSDDGGLIEQFGACFGDSDDAMECLKDIPASTNALFDDSPDRVLCASQPGRLDLSLHVPETLTEGRYAGRVYVLARSVHGVCETDQEHDSD